MEECCRELEHAFFLFTSLFCWNADNAPPDYFDACVEAFQLHVKRAICLWHSVEAQWPNNEVVRVGWIVRASTAAAAIDFLACCDDVIGLIQEQEREQQNHPPAKLLHSFMLQQLREKFEFSPTERELQTLQNAVRLGLKKELQCATRNEAVDTDYVTLLQCAAIVNRKKRTLERWKTEDTEFPTPEIIGQNGQPDEWLWATIRPYLTRKTNRKLPTKFPTLDGQ